VFTPPKGYSIMKKPMASEQSKLLLEHYREYQRLQERTVSLREFAKYLNINESTLNLLINDKRPMSNHMALHLAKKTGDNRFLDVQHLPHPDPNYTYVTSEWTHLSDYEKRAIRDQVAEYRTKKKQ